MYNVHRRYNKTSAKLLINLKEWVHLGGLAVDGSIYIETVFNVCEFGLACSWYGKMVGLFQSSNLRHPRKDGNLLTGLLKDCDVQSVGTVHRICVTGRAIT